MNKRNVSIDRARAMLIILVVYGHVITYANAGWSVLPYSFMFSIVSSFHMPAFFLLTGLLIYDEKWLNQRLTVFISRNIRTLIIPYFFFETVAVFYKALVLRNQSFLVGWRNLFLLKCNVGADWFLPAMFIARSIYYIYIRTKDNKAWYGVIGLCFFCMWFIPQDGMWLSTLSRGIVGFGFIWVGHFIRVWYLGIDKQDDLFIIKAIGASAIICICAVLNFKFFSNSFFDCVMDNPIVFLAGGISGLYVILSLAHVFEWKWLSYLGKNSLILMGTHQLILYTVPNNTSFLWVVGTMCLIAVVEIPVIYLTNNYCPMLVGKRKGETNGD